MPPVRMILDVDTGVDDALALALAVRHPDIQLEAVLTVAGNVGLDLTTRNTLRVLDWLAASHIAVAAGADRPLKGVRREATRWHGSDGLGGAALPEAARHARTDAVDYLIERVMAEPGELTLVCTAPLTNLALAVQRRPELASAVRRVVLMGGVARPPGNVTPVAEFNIYADPDAAAVVFGQSWPVTMVGLDVTTRVQLTRADLEAVACQTSPEAVLVREVTRQLLERPDVPGMAMHDPLAVAVAVMPDLVTTRDVPVEIETIGQHTRGQTVVDLRPAQEAPLRTTRVCMDVDAERFRALFFETLGLQFA
jgi:inosine-uridine nucleoside N-ribohydrolase